MTKELAKVRTKQIDLEQKKIEKIWLPFQLLMMVGIFLNLFSEKDVFPNFLTTGYVVNVILLVAFVGVGWVFIKNRKLSKEKDTILSEHGVW